MTPFRVLYREFLFRVVDLELLGERGDAQRLLGQFGALLAAFSFTTSLSSLQFVFSKEPPEVLIVRAWPSQHFLIATTMLVVGIFTLFAWDQLFLDRRDVLVLAPLPLPARTIFLAKLAAVATALGLVVLALNCFTGLAFPVHFMPLGSGFFGWVRALAAYWITVGAAAAFIACSLVSLQGLMAQTLSRARFLRWSGWAQVAAFCLLLAVYFLQPTLAVPQLLARAESQASLRALPSYWFWGLFPWLNGDAGVVESWLAARAAVALAMAASLAGLLFATSYRRTIRRTVEQPDIVPGRASGQASRGRGIATVLDSTLSPLGTAVALFVVRSILRSRQHRVILAGYLGTGLAIALAYGNSLRTGRAADPWWRANIPMLVASDVMICFGVVGIRALFDLPLAVRANWIFRVTHLRPARDYLQASWLALFGMAVLPWFTFAAVALLAIWPAGAALGHLVWLILFGALLASVALKNCRKIPFTCTYLPGKANLHVMVGVYVLLLTMVTDFFARVELESLRRLAGYAKFAGFTLLAAWWTWRRARNAWGEAELQFEDVPEEVVVRFVRRG